MRPHVWHIQCKNKTIKIDSDIVTSSVTKVDFDTVKTFRI